jgi:hypothetical protein
MLSLLEVFVGLGCLSKALEQLGGRLAVRRRCADGAGYAGSPGHEQCWS